MPSLAETCLEPMAGVPTKACPAWVGVNINCRVRVGAVVGFKVETGRGVFVESTWVGRVEAVLEGSGPAVGLGSAEEANADGPVGLRRVGFFEVGGIPGEPFRRRIEAIAIPKRPSSTNPTYAGSSFRFLFPAGLGCPAPPAGQGVGGA